MPEITQEEWQDIELVYKAFCGDGRPLSNLELSIMKKLKYMIDKEHKHEYVKIHSNPNIHDWGDSTYYKCINCGDTI